MDVHILEKSAFDNIGDLTFLEAYMKTRRVLNIIVFPERQDEIPVLLNYLTAPNLLIRTAACASCAIPGLYDSVELLGKDATGKTYSWHPTIVKFQDAKPGSQITNQLLTELFNVNNFIVSEMNPASMSLYKMRPGRELGILARIVKFCFSEIKHRMYQLNELGLLPEFLTQFQKYLHSPVVADVVIYPPFEVSDLKLAFSNPSKGLIETAVFKGERSTWPLVSQIKARCAIEMVVEDILQHKLRNEKTPDEPTPIVSGKKRTKSFQ